MDAWNVAILAAAGYVAVTALVRLMIRRRNQMLEQFRREVDKEKRRRHFRAARAGETGPETSGVDKKIASRIHDGDTEDTKQKTRGSHGLNTDETQMRRR